VTKVVNNIAKKNGNVEENAIQTIAFPNQSLISVRSDQSDPQFTGAIMSASNTKSGDENLAIERSTSMSERDYMYAFVSGGGLSAGLWSNSEHDGRAATQSYNGGNQNTRVLATTQSVDSATSLGLASAPWYWHRTVSDTNGRKYTLEQTDLPKMAVAIAGDANDDKAVNWEDGAIAYRDIMNNPYKSEEVPELVSWRIAMNFGSQAQNPFLTTLDNVKKVALNTDGLGQSVLLKGYGNEGHDSAHPDYGDINARAGGAADMNTLMEGAAEYGARIGIHVNASEMYPEAKAFSDSLVRRNANGSLYYSWDWIDQAIGINGIYDLASGSRASRFQALKDQVGDNMDFVYLDVWGTKHSGSEDSWETRRIANTINALGWSVGTEYGTAMEYEATFHHWAADLTGGSAQMKGENSQVMRFLRNHQKDSWMGDYPSYGQPSNAPLLGGYSMKDFEGWQGRNDYAAYITNLYTHDVSTKFIQHFKVTQWVNSPLDATSVKDASVNGGNEQITLKDSYGNVVVLKRGSNDVNDAAYRERTIT
ncbi:endo-alpha-N-acetylgalactosaminidase family protein, partial [Bifidobacterium jacchi]